MYGMVSARAILSDPWDSCSSTPWLPVNELSQKLSASREAARDMDEPWRRRMDWMISRLLARDMGSKPPPPAAVAAAVEDRVRERARGIAAMASPPFGHWAPPLLCRSNSTASSIASSLALRRRLRPDADDTDDPEEEGRRPSAGGTGGSSMPGTVGIAVLRIAGLSPWSVCDPDVGAAPGAAKAGSCWCTATIHSMNMPICCCRPSTRSLSTVT
mmetsp:Transcript_8988/g.25679  ORF Transcript_8988/g.25679 Transcript_8988/m.25679 type:complete len:215 (+) Transcript_8988:306-950(+)